MRKPRLILSGADAKLAALFLLILAVFFGYLAIVTREYYGGADEIVHYWMARFSWKHPELFLDLWGKPMYTTLASPVAQLGFEAIRLFNVLLALLTALFSFLILRMIKTRYAFTVIPLLLFAPVYFPVIPAALTEVLFGLVLVLFIYLFLSGKADFATVLVSFLPFARNEGIVLLPVIGLLFLFLRYYRGIALLLVGHVLMSIIGWLVFGDVLWLIHQNPYRGNDLYGSGNLFHFAEATKYTTGLIMAVLAAAGWVLMTIKLCRRECRHERSTIVFLYLGSMLFLVYFLAHSVAWYIGGGLSLGLIRVIAGVVPLAAMAAAWFLSYLAERIPSQWLRALLLALVILPSILYPLYVFRPPRPESDMQKPGRLAAEWILANYPEDTRIVCFDPRILFLLDRDPWDSESTNAHLHWRDYPSKSLRTGEVMVWDAQFGGAEAGIARELLTSDSSLTEVAAFRPIDTTYVMGSFFYEILVFEKTGVKPDSTGH